MFLQHLCTMTDLAVCTTYYLSPPAFWVACRCAARLRTATGFTVQQHARPVTSVVVSCCLLRLRWRICLPSYTTCPYEIHTARHAFFCCRCLHLAQPATGCICICALRCHARLPLGWTAQTPALCSPGHIVGPLLWIHISPPVDIA